MAWELTKQMIAALIRWLLAYVALRMVEKGIVDAETAQAWVNAVAIGVAGAIVLAVPVLWKYANARYHILSVIFAVQTDPPADDPKEIKAAVEDVKAKVAESGKLTSSV